MDDAHRQLASPVRFEWGASGAQAVAQGADVAIVVDVLSFTTTLTVAADLGTVVLPYPWDDEHAARYAEAHGATLAVRRADRTGGISLSPASVRTAAPVERLVLPSPNGSAIAYQLQDWADTVIGASFRNVGAVAAWVAAHHDAATVRVAVVASGERWPDGSLRPCVEDAWGAGAMILALSGHGIAGTSPEAVLAAGAYLEIRGYEADALMSCSSGRELAARGFTGDVRIAAEVDRSESVPVLRGGAFLVDGPPSLDDRPHDPGLTSRGAAGGSPG